MKVLMLNEHCPSEATLPLHWKRWKGFSKRSKLKQKFSILGIDIRGCIACRQCAQKGKMRL